MTRLETDSCGREITAVHVERNGAKETYRGNIVVVSGGAINSAALLLRSANDKHPNGLANGSDVVGRHYMGHTNSVLMALSKCPNPTVFQKTLSVNDFYFGSLDWNFPMGHISFVGKLDSDTLKAAAPKVAPKWTLDLMGKHSLDFCTIRLEMIQRQARSIATAKRTSSRIFMLSMEVSSVRVAP